MSVAQMSETHPEETSPIVFIRDVAFPANACSGCQDFRYQWDRPVEGIIFLKILFKKAKTQTINFHISKCQCVSYLICQIWGSKGQGLDTRTILSEKVNK